MILLVLSLIASNFIWQALRKDPNWATAAERSYFQTVAVLITWWVLR